MKIGDTWVNLGLTRTVRIIDGVVFITWTADSTGTVPPNTAIQVTPEEADEIKRKLAALD